MTTRIINTTDEVSKWIAENWQDDVHPSQMDAIAQVLSDWAADEGYGYGADCLDYLETITEDDIITLRTGLRTACRSSAMRTCKRCTQKHLLSRNGKIGGRGYE